MQQITGVILAPRQAVHEYEPTGGSRHGKPLTIRHETQIRERQPKLTSAKPSRASAVPPASFRPKGAATTLVPKPLLTGSHAPKARAPKGEWVQTPESGADDAAAPLKKQELIAKVVERSDVPKKHAKPVVEAMLAVLGDALGEGRELNLQPMGKAKSKRQKDTGKGHVIIANIRQTHAGAGALVEPAPEGPMGATQVTDKEAVADDAE